MAPRIRSGYSAAFDAELSVIRSGPRRGLGARRRCTLMCVHHPAVGLLSMLVCVKGMLSYKPVGPVFAVLDASNEMHPISSDGARCACCELRRMLARLAKQHGDWTLHHV